MSVDPCISFEPLLHDAVDERLDAGRAARLDRHLATCDDCRARLQQLRWMRAALAAAVDPGRDEELDASLRRVLETEVGAPVSASGEPVIALSRRRLLTGTIAAAASIAGLLWMAGRDRRDALASTRRLSDEWSEHAGATLPADLAVLDAVGLAERFAGAGLDFPARVIDLAAMDVKVVGGSTRSFDGRPATLVLYDAPFGRMLCRMIHDPGRASIVPESPPALRENGFEFRTIEHAGLSLVFWHEGPVACVLVARAAVTELLALARAKAMAPPIG